MTTLYIMKQDTLQSKSSDSSCISNLNITSRKLRQSGIGIGKQWRISVVTSLSNSYASTQTKEIVLTTMMLTILIQPSKDRESMGLLTKYQPFGGIQSVCIW